ncbi:MAG: TIGR00299 family protein [halophilic archaeon J07HX5]|nr:MAG: TIGR00299 family protein [halophilic archaeon J07HX5]
MRTLAFDGRMGASGDMLLGALLAAGADWSALTPAIEGLPVEYESDTTTRAAITATTVDVTPGDVSNAQTSESDTAETASRNKGQAHADSHSHDYGHGQNSADSHEHAHAEGDVTHRSHEAVKEIIRELELPTMVRQQAEQIVDVLAESEAAVHGTDTTAVRFHEVGADDAIADIVGVCLLVDDLSPERIVTTPLAAGGGETEMTHGTYPVPAPAVVELAAQADWELHGGPVEAELLTPTGAAILTVLADGVDTLPSLAVEATGYGAGLRTFPDRPNVLRATVGERAGDLRREPIAVLETNLDDAAPELLGGLQESLIDAGAVDVSVLPATMKKARPGHLVKVVAPRAKTRQVATRLAKETGTLGVRATRADHRFVADRSVETVELTIDDKSHAVAVKIARTRDGEVFDVSAEFDDVQAVAAETGLATKTILDRAEQQANQSVVHD